MCSIIESCFCGAAPFQEGTRKGIFLSTAKLVTIGLIVTIALAAGVYFAKMAIYNAWNLNMSLRTQMGFSITSACIVGLIGLAATAGCIGSAKDRLAKIDELDGVLNENQ